MAARGPLRLDVVIFGGGGAGLWLLDELARRGHQTLLLEAHELGGGQTVNSQGIIHGGFKYSLDGLLSASARATRAMPDLWRRCLAGAAPCGAGAGGGVGAGDRTSAARTCARSTATSGARPRSSPGWRFWLRGPDSRRP